MSYPDIIQIAWNTVTQFVRDWQESPYQWAREIDIQVELASRLKTLYRNTGFGTIDGCPAAHTFGTCIILGADAAVVTFVVLIGRLPLAFAGLIANAEVARIVQV